MTGSVRARSAANPAKFWTKSFSLKHTCKKTNFAANFQLHGTKSNKIW